MCYFILQGRESKQVNLKKKGDLSVISRGVKDWTPGKGTENTVTEMDDRQAQGRAVQMCLWGLVTCSPSRVGGLQRRLVGVLGACDWVFISWPQVTATQRQVLTTSTCNLQPLPLLTSGITKQQHEDSERENRSLTRSPEE